MHRIDAQSHNQSLYDLLRGRIHGFSSINRMPFSPATDGRVILATWTLQASLKRLTQLLASPGRAARPSRHGAQGAAAPLCTCQAGPGVRPGCQPSLQGCHPQRCLPGPGRQAQPRQHCCRKAVQHCCGGHRQVWGLHGAEKVSPQMQAPS